jgi:WD40 repeat protein
MLRLLIHLTCPGLLLLLGVVSCMAQEVVPRCEPARPLPQNPRHGIVGLSFSRDGKTLVSAGGDGNIKFWDVATGQVKRTLSGHTNAVYKAIFSPDEKLLASSSRDATARIWDVATGKELHTLAGYRCAVKFVAFSPDGKTLAATGNDGVLKLWDVKTGREKKSLVHTDSTNVDVGTYSAIFSRDGKKLYASNGDGTISQWDVATGTEAKAWKAHSLGVFSLAFSPDYRVLASNGYFDYTVKLWDVATRREIRALANKKTEGLQEKVQAIAFSPNGKSLAVSEVGFDPKLKQYAYNRTNVWDVETGEKRFTVNGHKFDIDAVLFTPDSRYVVSGSADGTIKFWDADTGRESRTLTTRLSGRTNN